MVEMVFRRDSKGRKDIVILDKMPITQNVKIDYRELNRKYNLI